MEYLPNDLRKIFKACQEEQTVLTEDHIIIILYNLLCATSYIHKCGLIHRDLKPANVLISLNCEVKICDFGLARSIPEDLTSADNLANECKKMRQETQDYSLPADSTERLSRKKAFEKSISNFLVSKLDRNEEGNKRQLSSAVLSRWYRSPEIILCEKEYSQAVDMWSIGCILHELIHSCEAYVPKRSKKVSEYFSNRHAFPGDSCFPISPCRDEK
jgi:serine/threonine protein kinase